MRNALTTDQLPVPPPPSTARTRQNSLAVGSEAVASCDVETTWLSASVEKALDVLTWIVYDAAPATSLQSKRTRSPGRKRVSCAGVSSCGAASVADGNGFTVNVADLVTPPPVTEITTVRVVAGGVRVNTRNPPVVDPAGMVTAASTVASVVSLLVSASCRSVDAGAAMVTVPDEPLVPVVVVGLSVIDAGCCCGVRVT